MIIPFKKISRVRVNYQLPGNFCKRTNLQTCLQLISLISTCMSGFVSFHFIWIYHQYKSCFTYEQQASLIDVKVYKAISDSLENHNIMNCIMLRIILNYLICILNFGWILCKRGNMNKPVNILLKHFVIQHFILIMVTVMYNNLYMQYLLKVDGLMIEWIFMQHSYILLDFISVRYNFIHFTEIMYIFMYA